MDKTYIKINNQINKNRYHLNTILGSFNTVTTQC